MNSIGVRLPDLVAAMVPGQNRSRALGKLVHFDKRGRQRKARPTAEGDAQIFLFTGVRYERDGTPVPDKPSNTARPKRKRG